MICYKKADLHDLEIIWDRSIADNPGDDRYIRWKEEFIHRNLRQEAATYVITLDEEPVAEVTLDCYAQGYGKPASRSLLADGKNSAYVTALRIRKDLEGKGYISQLMRFMEQDAKSLGFSRLTIGVEA